MKKNSPTTIEATPGKRGGAILLLLAFALFALFGFAALAVDLGYLYQTKALLQVTASAAATAAALDLPDESAALATAINFARHNMPTGEHGEVLVSSNAAFGNWDDDTRTFTVGGTPVNAVRVVTRRHASGGNAVGTFFGQILGVSEANITARATAKKLPDLLGAIAAGGSISITGNLTIDSYDSTEGSYDLATAGENGDIAASGDVSLSGSAEINGDVRGETVTMTEGAEIGETLVSRRDVDYPSVDISAAEAENDNDTLPLITQGNKLVSPLDAEGNFRLTAGVAYDIPPGVYLFNDLTLDGQSSLNISGPTDIYLTGDLDTSGGDVINSTEDPNNLRILMTGGTAVLSASVDWYGLLYAPDSEIIINGTADIYGAIIGENVTASGSGDIHFDEGLVLGDDISSRLAKRSNLVQ